MPYSAHWTGATTMSDDWITQDREHLLRMEKEKTRQVQAKTEARSEMVKAVALAVGAIVFVGIAVAAVWTGVQRSSERESEQTVACTQGGGTMFDLKTGGRVCLRLEGSDE